MRAKVVPWTDAAKVKKILAQRLKEAKEHRRRLCEEQWRANERAVYGDVEQGVDPGFGMEGVVGDSEDFDVAETIEVNYVFRNHRFIHSQLSANPPVASPRPESTDLEDRRAAKAANHCMKWFLRNLELLELHDQVGLETVTYGTGVARTGFNPFKGDVIEFDQESGELVLDGQIEAVQVSVWNFWIDPHARNLKEIRHTFEGIELSEEEAAFRFPGKADLFRTRGNQRDLTVRYGDGTTLRLQEKSEEKRFQVYAYVEPGLPENGNLGRFCYHLEDGTLLTPVVSNPNLLYPAPDLEERKAFRKALAADPETPAPEKLPPVAYLPYHIWTDIDVPGQVWGRSFLQYAGPAQNLMKNLDSATLEVVRCHGVARLILPEGARMAEPSNSNTEVYQMEKGATDGLSQPQFIAPPAMPNAMPELRANMRTGVDDMAGMNESMLGQQSREQSGQLMQYAVNQGSMIRRRLFNKDALWVESLYKALLALAIQNWDEAQLLRIMGKEEAMESISLRGIDIHGGYEIETTYGTTLPLDPMSRRDELLKLMPIYKDAGIDTKILVENMQLAELESVEDAPQLAKRRAQEWIDYMIAKHDYVKPRKFQDHVSIIAYFKEFVMRADFAELDDATKSMIERHIEERMEYAANEAKPTGPTGGAPTPPTGLAPTPGPALMPQVPTAQPASA
jgi:hypothetical protein